jgi:SNF2 family DNA or RNA helicase
MTMAERTKAVERFNNDKETRVLMISSVGGIGLDLTIASVVICFVSENKTPKPKSISLHDRT